MAEYGELCKFNNLYAAHKATRRGKSWKKEVIEFELNLAENLCVLKRRLEKNDYMPHPYNHFIVHEPKRRDIHALRYADRVVQRCLCDKIVSPQIEKRLIYDNAACRRGKGTHFAIYRFSEFLRDHHRVSGEKGYFLKCDFAKYFESIDHDILKERLSRVGFDCDTIIFLERIIDSYQSRPGKGLPLGNQTSQWFALYYLDPLDRLIKERLHIKFYSRYMDDLVLIHESKEYLKESLSAIRELAEEKLLLRLNEKTQIFPIKNGVNYLGFHFYLADGGKVIRKVRPDAKKRFRKALLEMQSGYKNGIADAQNIDQRIHSYLGHLSHGHTWNLRTRLLSDFVLQR